MDTTASGKIGKYEVIGLLGRGGMGEVILARDNLGRKVAIKRPFPNALVDGLDRFQVEARAATLDHPNIPAVYELGEQDGLPFIAMEFVEGESLEKIIKSGKPIDLILKLGIIEQVCLALGYAHQKGIIHRDVKPANVIVRPDGVAKIIDFGIAKIQSQDGNTRLTQPSQLIGTLHYLAPERLKGQSVDGRADIFSAGVMLYLLLTGQLPFGGGEETAPYRIVNEAPTSLGEHLREYPAALDAILAKSLAKNPNDRFSIAEDFADALHEVVDELTRTRSLQLFDDAERLATERRFEPALEILQEVIKLDPNNTQARKLRTLVRGKLDEIRKKKLFDGYISRADELIAAANFPEALSSLKKAEEIFSTAAEVRERIDFVEAKIRRQERTQAALTEAEATRKRGDFTAALRILAKAIQEDPENGELIAAQSALARQVENEAQEAKIGGIVESVRRELLRRDFDAVQRLLAEAAAVDATHPEIDKLHRELARARQHEERLYFLDETRKQLDAFLRGGNFDSATDLIAQALQKFPDEMLLNRWRTEVEATVRDAHTKRFVDAAIARAKELFSTSPAEAIAVLDQALEQMRGDERLLSYKRSLQQELDVHRVEQLRAAALRTAQEFVAASQFDKAVGTLESFQLEFGSHAEVDELLAFARDRQARQQREALVDRCTGEVRTMVRDERLDEAIRVLEYGIRETNDASLIRLLEEVREQQTALVRKLEVLQKRVILLRDRGELDEAIVLLQEYLAATPNSPRVVELQKALQSERERKQIVREAIRTADEAVQRKDYSAAIGSLQAVERAYGESPELTPRIQELQTARAAHAKDIVGHSLETARTAVAKNDAQGALAAIESSAALVEFAEAAQQQDWKRIGQVAKEALRKPQATISLDNLKGPIGQRRGLPVWLVAVICVVLAAAGVGAYLIFRPHPDTKTHLTITTDPEDAQVWIDKGKPGQVDASGGKQVTLEAGKHSVEYSKSTFRTITKDYQLTSGSVGLYFTLTPSDQANDVAEITLESDTPEFNLSLDQETSSRLRHNGEVLPLKYGPHTLIGSTVDNTVVKKVTLTVVANMPQTAKLLFKEPITPNKANDSKANNEKNPAPTTGAQNTPTVTNVQGPGVQSNQTLTPTPTTTPTPNLPQPILPPSGHLNVSSASIVRGASVKITWDSSNTGSVTIEDVSSRAVVGSKLATSSGDQPLVVSPQVSTTYQLKDANGNWLAQTRVEVTEPAKPPSVDTTAADRQGIEAARERFVSAYNSMNIAAVRAEWKEVDSQYRDLDQLFKSYKSHGITVKIAENCGADALIFTSDTTAEWVCQESILRSDDDPKKPHSPNKVKWKLTKIGDRWRFISQSSR